MPPRKSKGGTGGRKRKRDESPDDSTTKLVVKPGAAAAAATLTPFATAEGNATAEGKAVTAAEDQLDGLEKVRQGIFQSLLLPNAFTLTSDQWLEHLCKTAHLLSGAPDPANAIVPTTCLGLHRLLEPLASAAMGLDNGQWHCDSELHSAYHVSPIWAWVELCAHVCSRHPSNAIDAKTHLVPERDGEALVALHNLLRLTGGTTVNILNALHPISGESLIRYAARMSGFAFRNLLGVHGDQLDPAQVFAAKVLFAIHNARDSVGASLVRAGWRYASVLNDLLPFVDGISSSTLAYAVNAGLVQTVLALLQLRPAIWVNQPRAYVKGTDIRSPSRCAELWRKAEPTSWVRAVIANALSAAEAELTMLPDLTRDRLLRANLPLFRPLCDVVLAYLFPGLLPNAAATPKAAAAAAAAAEAT